MADRPPPPPGGVPGAPPALLLPPHIPLCQEMLPARPGLPGEQQLREDLHGLPGPDQLPARDRPELQAEEHKSSGGNSVPVPGSFISSRLSSGSLQRGEVHHHLQ